MKLREQKNKGKTFQKQNLLPNQNKEIRTFDDYYSKTHQLTSKKLRLERAMREYEVGIKREKSALDNFAEKYIIDEKLEIIPIDYFGEKAPQLKDFFRNQKY